MNSNSRIHPTALVEDGAHLGDGCVVHAHAIITKYCDLGAEVVIHPFAVVGGDPQDLQFDPAIESRVCVGARTVIREHVTVNRATKVGKSTRIGSDCFLMAASHVAHDCQVGDRVIMANAVLLGGHVMVGDKSFLGGGALVHQFCRIGEGAMIGGGARISSDIAPFCMAAERNSIIGLNIVGLRRRGVAAEVFREIKHVFRALDLSTGNLREKAATLLGSGQIASAEAISFLSFFSGGRRGFARTRLTEGATDGSD